MRICTFLRSTGSVAAGILLLACAGLLNADDDTEHFLLPETPPTIERMKRPPLDRPVLKRQNFISDTAIVPPPVLLDNGFQPFAPVTYPAVLGLARGSFDSSYGDFLYSSKNGWQLSYHLLDSRGEYPNLFREDHRLAGGVNRQISPEVRIGGTIDLDQNTVWTQRHNLYRISGNADWYGWENMNIKARFAGAKGEITGIESDASWSGDIQVDLQPAELQNIRFLFAPRYDSAFDKDRAFLTCVIRYDILAARWLTVNAGGRYQKDTLFPQGMLTFRMLPRCSFSVAYEPGFDRPEWMQLYGNDRYETVAPGILTPESSFLLKERLSYYWDEYSFCDVQFSQGKWKNYVFWSQVTGTDFIAPANASQEYVSSLALDCRHAGKWLTPSIGFQANSNAHLPFVPEYQIRLGLQAQYRAWTLSAGYRYVSDMFFAVADPGKLPAFNDLSLSIARVIVPGIDITVAGDNLLGEKIETQPGFFRKSPAFQVGVNLKF